MNYPGFIGGSARVRAPGQAAETCINWYVEASEAATGKNVARLTTTPGLRRFCLLPESPIRGLYTTAPGRAFAVAGAGLYELFQGGSFIKRGTLQSRVGYASMADNGLELVLVDGTEAGYLLTLADNVYAPIVSDGFYEDAGAIA